jgi:hypothetical protein
MHNSKVCFKCLIEKELKEFYKHKDMMDGHLNKCKECTKKDTKENIEKNKDYYLEYDKSRSMLAHRVEARKKYSQTEEGKNSLRKAKKKWSEENVVKRSAQIIVNNAVRNGKLIKPKSCEICRKENNIIHGHHDDYDYPLKVKWLCPKCHSNIHKK